jgi:hypothetical protein
LRINNEQVEPILLNEQFLADIVTIPERDADRIFNYIRKRISKRAKVLENSGDRDGLNTARREAKARFGDGWRDSLVTKTIYKAEKSNKRSGLNWCPEENRDFGYPNEYWK